MPIPKGSEADWKQPTKDIDPHRTINEIRQYVAVWRDGNWKGVHPRVFHLLEFWAREGAEMRPFWCQREAIETLIWLFDAGCSQDPDAHARILKHLREVNRNWNRDISRVALKMATGTGKTNLIAMIALWWTVRQPGKRVNFVAIAPGITIRERLKVLSDKSSDVWRSIAPRGFESDLKRMRWNILNFQAFQRQSKLKVGGKTATTKEKQLLRGSGQDPEHWQESEAEMLDRLLRVQGEEVTVFNDEAHHCYTLQGINLGGAKSDSEEKQDQKRAELWFGALRALKSSGRLKQVFDLSATPMWLRRPVSIKAETFPWTVTDFSLLDAVESGLVKVPRVPVAEIVNENGKPRHLHPRYRNIYLYNEKRSIGEPLFPEIRDPLHELYGHYRDEVAPAYENAGIIPTLIVVANTIENATAIYRYIAGYKDQGTWKPGQLELFSNIDRTTGLPKPELPTILVHSKLDDPSESNKGKIAQAIAEQAEIFSPETKTAEERRIAIQEIFLTVGKKGSPGGKVRCVVSVGMLTEGWDARNVTHVFGYRAFGSQLLCEQVAGRALRRTSFTGKDEIQPIEYANLFGVPFAWISGKGTDAPTAPVSPQPVYTVLGRSKFRLYFPNVVGYAPGRTRPHWEIDPARFSKIFNLEVKSRPNRKVIVEGSGGKGLSIEGEIENNERAVWRAAAHLVPKLHGGAEGRRFAFIDCLGIIRKCLRHLDINQYADLVFDDPALDTIASIVVRSDSEPFTGPVFADQREPGQPRSISTADIYFETTLRHWHFTKKSELNAAACHSKPEEMLSAILDDHAGVSAWVRNFNLGWRVPWFDTERGATAFMEPDFVAKSKTVTKCGRIRYLIIEFKGLMAGKQRENAKRRYLEELWVPAVSRLEQGENDNGDWKAVWIENIEHAERQISEACRI